MITVRNLTKKYKTRTVVEEVSFEVNEGETLVLLGTSGSGKTTTLKMINRLIEPTSGTITIQGVDVGQRSLHELRREIGYVIQETGLFPHYTIADNIALIPRVLKWSEPRIQERVRELISLLRLPETCLRTYPSQLSGGQRQRVGIARALAAQPSILLMDEPLGALDPVTRSHIRREFRQMEELRQKTIVMVTHDVQEAFELGDRVGLMNDGQLQQIGTPQQLLLQPANDFVRQFFADQWLPLQLHTFSLLDLAPYLPVEPTPPAGALRLPASTRLAEALGHLVGSNSIVFQTDERVVTVHLTTVWSALSQVFQQQPSS